MNDLQKVKMIKPKTYLIQDALVITNRGSTILAKDKFL